jgi:ABC-2 type transport system permease protein
MPLLLLIFTVGFGSGTIAGEEEKGTLDILLANPIERWQVVVEKFIAMAISTTILAAVTAAAIIIGTALADMEVSSENVVAIVASVELLALAFGSIALFLGCLSGSRGLSMGVTSALALVSFFLHALAPLANVLKDYQKFSLFYHYLGENPLQVGLKLEHVFVLVAVSLVFLILSLVVFQRRDLRI